MTPYLVSALVRGLAFVALFQAVGRGEGVILIAVLGATAFLTSFYSPGAL